MARRSRSRWTERTRGSITPRGEFPSCDESIGASSSRSGWSPARFRKQRRTRRLWSDCTRDHGLTRTSRSGTGTMKTSARGSFLRRCVAASEKKGGAPSPRRRGATGSGGSATNSRRRTRRNSTCYSGAISSTRAGTRVWRRRMRFTGRSSRSAKRARSRGRFARSSSMVAGRTTSSGSRRGVSRSIRARWRETVLSRVFTTDSTRSTSTFGWTSKRSLRKERSGWCSSHLCGGRSRSGRRRARYAPRTTTSWRRPSRSTCSA